MSQHSVFYHARPKRKKDEIRHYSDIRSWLLLGLIYLMALILWVEYTHLPGPPERSTDEQLLLSLGGSFYTADMTGEAHQTLNLGAIFDGIADLSVSPSGEHFAFSGTIYAETRIYLANSDGSWLTALSAGPHDTQPIWSPDGTAIVFTRRHGPEMSALYRVNISTGYEYGLTGFELNQDPQWSRDGNWIIYSSLRGTYQDIYRMSADGGHHEQLTNNLYRNERHPIYSPDGQSIAYISYLSQGDGSGEVWLMRADGSEHRQITRNHTDEHQVAWSPDGTALIFVSVRPDGRGTDIMQYDVMTATSFNLTHRTGSDHSPVWSPDGQSIIFISDRHGPRGGYYRLSLTDMTIDLIFKDAQQNAHTQAVWMAR